jgi:hypothetical protein
MARVQLLNPKFAAYGTAAGLSILTLAVFAYSKDMGPESAVRRFHQAAIEGNTEEIRRTVVLDDRSSRELAIAVRQELSQSVAVQLGRSGREGRRAYVDVIYQRPVGFVAVRFVVEKPGLRWRIDAKETIQLFSRMSQFD